MTREELLRVARAQGSLETIRGLRFTISTAGDAIIFTPLSSGYERRAEPAETDAVLARYRTTGSLRPVDTST